MGVRGRVLLLALLAVAVAAAGWHTWQEFYAPGSNLVRPAAGTPGTMSLAQAVSEYRKTYHLTPDRRFQTALADVHRLVHGRSPTQVTATVSDSGADFAIDGQAVGRVPPLPSFQDLFGVLTEYARRGITEEDRLERRPGLPRTRAKDEFFAGAALPALDRLGGEWAKDRRNADTVEHAAELLTGLLLQAETNLDTDDPLAARALAALAVTRSLDPESVRSEECLVSYLLGYSAHSRRVTEKSPVDPAIAAFVWMRDSELAEAAKGDDPRARYLNLIRLAWDDPEKWRRAVMAWQPKGAERAWVLASTLDRISFESSNVPLFVLAANTEEWLQKKVPDRDPRHWALSHSEDVLAAMRAAADKHEGVFADADVAFSVYGSLQLAALYQAMTFPLHTLSSIPASREVLDAIPRTESGPLSQMRRWFSVQIEWHERTGNPDARIALLTDPSFPLGGDERGSLLGDSSWTPSIHGGHGGARDRLKLLLGMLDSRPEHRIVAVPLVRNRMVDPARADWLETSVARDNGPRSPAAWIASLGRHGGVTALREHVRLVNESSSELTWAARWLADHDREPAEVEALFREMWARPELRRSIFYSYANVLTEHERFAELERISREYLADPASDHGVARAQVTARIAESVRMQGRPEAAWELVRDEIPGQVGAIFQEGIDVLVDLGHYDQAESLARAALERYPHSEWLQARLAKAQWRAGRFEDAARAVTSPAADMDDDDFSDAVAPNFWLGLEKASDGDVLRAFDVLVRADAKQDFRTHAGSIAALFARRGRHALAFEMYARLARLNLAVMKDPEAMPLYDPPEATLQREKWRSELLGRAWHSLRAWKGEAEATRWALSLSPKGYPWDAAPHLLRVRAYPLLWDAYTSKDPGEYVWLLRADAVTRDPEMMRIHGDDVRSYFGHAGKSKDRYLARVMLGLESEAEALERPVRKTDLCQLAYSAGLAAQQRGELWSAVEYYQAALETNEDSYNAVGYARRQLLEWREADLAFDKSWQPGVTERPGPVASLR